MAHFSRKLLIAVFLITPLFIASNSAADMIQRGRAVFGLCTQCHGPVGEGNPALKAPAIAGMPSWYTQLQLKKFRSGARGKLAGDLGGHRMRPMANTLKESDLEIISQYVASLPPKKPTSDPAISGDSKNGQASFQTCVACHGANGLGNEALKAPPLIYLNDWYLKSQLKNFSSGLRGQNGATDPEGAMMVPMAKTLSDEVAIDNVIAYIRTL